MSTRWDTWWISDGDTWWIGAWVGAPGGIDGSQIPQVSSSVVSCPGKKYLMNGFIHQIFCNLSSSITAFQ
jgi:hypothetical protein